MHGKTILTTSVPTAATDGRDCWFNPDFLFNQIANGDKGIAYVMVHEWLHKAGMHFVTYQNLRELHALATNMAADYWINDRIELADPKHVLTEMPQDANGKPIGLHDIKYRDWTIKRIFNDIMENAEKHGGGGGFDDHDWDGAKELTKEEAKQLKQDVTEAIRQGIHAGKRAGAGGLQDALGLEELITPKVDWRDALRMFMTSTCRKKERSTWRRPNRRYLHQDIVMPTLEGNSINELVLGRDTSGSMWGDRMTAVTSEMVGLAQTLNIDKIHVIDWDGEVEHHETYTSDTFKNAPELRTAHGGGGTDPTCVSDYLSKNNIKPDAVVMLTDGEICSWGNWTTPVLWAITNEANITAPVGKTINID